MEGAGAGELEGLLPALPTAAGGRLPVGWLLGLGAEAAADTNAEVPMGSSREDDSHSVSMQGMKTDMRTWAARGNMNTTNRELPSGHS